MGCAEASSLALKNDNSPETEPIQTVRAKSKS